MSLCVLHLGIVNVLYSVPFLIINPPDMSKNVRGRVTVSSVISVGPNSLAEHNSRFALIAVDAEGVLVGLSAGSLSTRVILKDVTTDDTALHCVSSGRLWVAEKVEAG